MLAIASAFLFYLWLPEVFCEKRCPSPRPPLKGTVACFRNNDSVSCATASFVGSLAEFSCFPFYKLSSEDRRTVRCLSNGSWSLLSPVCIPEHPRLSEFFKDGIPLDAIEQTNVADATESTPQLKTQKDCGRRSPSVALILRGTTAPRGAFPWHAALYHFLDGTYEYWCGGSLVSETAVITAAHCVWDVPPESLMLAFGKFHREYSVFESGVQKIRARRVETLESYQDVAGNYNGDIAVVVLERAVRVGPYSAPVCLDWGARREVVEGSTGVVVGWGLTEREALSDGLRAVRLSVVSDEECIASQEADFKKFVTYTSFCAGLRDGGGVCNGDSGGGMVFFDEGSGRWYLEGVVSVSPRRKGTPYCDPRFYTVFTKVGMFSRWVSGFGEVRGREGGGRGEGKGRDVQGVLFPHSVRMLQLAGLLPSP